MMKKWLTGLLLAAALLLSLPNAANALEIPDYGPVYVAGNPDLYPFEYYDAQTGTYQGILPQLYGQISRQTGLEFVYIHPGIRNQQDRLAKNCQVELVSAYVRGQVEHARRGVALQTLPDGQQICVGFTQITPDWLEELLRGHILELTDRQLLTLALAVPRQKPAQKVYLWAGIAGGILLLLIGILTWKLLRQKATQKKRAVTQSLDPLTGIGNSLYFETTFRHCISPINFALYYVCYISLDIQRIERYVGAPEAEDVQRYGADILSRTAADGDFTARVGDGVFLMALQAPTEEAAQTRIQEILDQLNDYKGSFLEEHRALFRAGIFRMDTANLPVETAVLNARQGYNAARNQKVPCFFAEKQLLSQEATRTELRRKLSGALKNREFLVYMQLIVEPDGRVAGAETLARWQNPEKGLLTPGMFIEPIKEAGLADKLDFYVMEEACRQLEQWSGTEKNHLWLSCNFARMTVSRDDFITRFREVLERYSFDPRRLMIELTEDSLMDNKVTAYRNILACKELGCQIALDDLGSGYSSLQDLCDYPIDMIKIDRGIVMKSVMPKGNALLHGLAKMGHDLGMKVLCEGVENEEENDCACGSGCDYIQGFYYSRVLPMDEANLFYERQKNARS